MAVTTLAFGQLADITGSSFEGNYAATVGAYRRQLETMFPLLVNLPFVIAVDKVVAKDDDQILPSSIVALLPPFSGG